MGFFEFAISNYGAIISPNFALEDLRMSNVYGKIDSESNSKEAPIHSAIPIAMLKNLETYRKDFALEHIPPLERRRLSTASKCAFSLLRGIQETDSESARTAFIVFSSFSGELNRCFEFLHFLANDDVISPSGFSLSVLNSTPALLAIKYKNQKEISAISANPSLEYALLNAVLRLNENPHSKALAISYYEKLSDSSAPSFYMSMLEVSKLGEDSCKQANSMQCSIEFKPQDSRSQSHLVLSDFALLHAIKNGTSNYSVFADGIKWQWNLKYNL